MGKMISLPKTIADKDVLSHANRPLQIQNALD